MHVNAYPSGSRSIVEDTLDKCTCINIWWLLSTSQPSSWTTSSQALSYSPSSFLWGHWSPLPYSYKKKISYLCDRDNLFNTSGYKPQSQENKLSSLLLNKMASPSFLLLPLMSSSSSFYFWSGWFSLKNLEKREWWKDWKWKSFYLKWACSQFHNKPQIQTYLCLFKCWKSMTMFTPLKTSVCVCVCVCVW